MLPPGTGDTLDIAQMVEAALSSLSGSGSLAVQLVTIEGALSPPPVIPGTTNELLLSTDGFNGSIPSGYQVVVVTGGGNTLTGSGVEILGGTVGGVYALDGNSTIAATGGDNLIFTSSSVGDGFIVSTGPGNNTIVASGTGQVADGAGSSLIFTSGNTTVQAAGQDTVVAGAGVTSLLAIGVNNKLVFGDFAPGGTLFGWVGGNNSTISAGNSDASLTLGGSDQLVFGAASGGGQLNVLDFGSGDTISGLTSKTTVVSAGSTGLMVFGGTGGLDFFDVETAAATVLTSAGPNAVTAGSGGLLMAGGGTDTVFGNENGGATLFGTSGNAMTYTGPGSILYAAGGGNETLSAASATGLGTFFASTQAGANDAIVGGCGSNIFVAGGGSDSFTGGAGGAGGDIFVAGSGSASFYDHGGADTFDFLSEFTAGAGGTDFVYNLGSNDTVNLVGYDSTKSSTSIIMHSLTLTLSDKTQIVFWDEPVPSVTIHYG